MACDVVVINMQSARSMMTVGECSMANGAFPILPQEQLVIFSQRDVVFFPHRKGCFGVTRFSRAVSRVAQGSSSRLTFTNVAFPFIRVFDAMFQTFHGFAQVQAM